MENLPRRVYETDKKIEVAEAGYDPCVDLLCNDTKMSKLAMELARDLYPAEQVLASYGLSPELFADRIAKSKSFMVFYAEFKEIWNSSSTTVERIAVKGGILLEQWLEEAMYLLHDRKSPMAPKVELAKWLSRVSGADNVNAPKKDGDQSNGSAGTTTVQINLGHGRQIVIQKEKSPTLVEGEVDFMAPVEPLPVQVTDKPEVNINMPDRMPSREARFIGGVAGFGSGIPTTGPGVLPVINSVKRAGQ